jgi:hypothetical protein
MRRARGRRTTPRKPSWMSDSASLPMEIGAGLGRGAARISPESRSTARITYGSATMPEAIVRYSLASSRRLISASSQIRAVSDLVTRL